MIDQKYLEQSIEMSNEMGIIVFRRMKYAKYLIMNMTNRDSPSIDLILGQQIQKWCSFSFIYITNPKMADIKLINYWNEKIYKVNEFNFYSQLLILCLN